LKWTANIRFCTVWQADWSAHFSTNKRGICNRLSSANQWLIWFLPAGGLLIVLLYKLSKVSKDIGTKRDYQLHTLGREGAAVTCALNFCPHGKLRTCSAVLRAEMGAALQIGGTIGYQSVAVPAGREGYAAYRPVRDEAPFSALFGTPLTAAIFAMEVVSVGVIYYSGLVPCLFSSLVAYELSLLLGAEPVRFTPKTVPDASAINILRIILLAALCAAVSILFCISLHKTHSLLERFIKNDFLRIFAGGAAIIALTFIIGTYDYNGAGMDVITRAVGGEARPEAFILKIIFTAITIGAGYTGGEIVPAFFIGATFGCAAGSLLGLDAGFGAAIGIAALFCGL
jgi:H+/Cl- antiporter ClcA